MTPYPAGDAPISRGGYDPLPGGIWFFQNAGYVTLRRGISHRHIPFSYPTEILATVYDDRQERAARQQAPMLETGGTHTERWCRFFIIQATKRRRWGWGVWYAPIIALPQRESPFRLIVDTLSSNWMGEIHSSRTAFFFVKHTRVSRKRPTTAATKRALYTNPTLHQAQGVISSGFCVWKRQRNKQKGIHQSGCSCEVMGRFLLSLERDNH